MHSLALKSEEAIFFISTEKSQVLLEQPHYRIKDCSPDCSNHKNNIYYLNHFGYPLVIIFLCLTHT